MIYIYTLSPKSNPSDIRYVGKTIDPAGRIRTHRYKAKDGNLYVNRWIRKLWQYQDDFYFNIIATITDDSWEEVEKFYIKYYRDLGADLTNIEDGGNARKVRKALCRQVKTRNNKKIRMLNKQTSEILIEFESVKKASEILGLNRFVLGECARGKRPSAYGFKWQYSF